MIGKTVSHHTITEKRVGRGMGEAYGAEEATSTGKWPSKSNPETFASDPERLARFERQAQ